MSKLIVAHTPRRLSALLTKLANSEVRAKLREDCQAVLLHCVTSAAGSAEVACAQLKGLEAALPSTVPAHVDDTGDKSEDENEPEPSSLSSLPAVQQHVQALFNQALHLKSLCRKVSR